MVFDFQFLPSLPNDAFPIKIYTLCFFYLCCCCCYSAGRTSAIFFIFFSLFCVLFRQRFYGFSIKCSDFLAVNLFILFWQLIFQLKSFYSCYLMTYKYVHDTQVHRFINIFTGSSIITFLKSFGFLCVGFFCA